MIMDLECPKCEVTCYIDIGDVNDLSMADPDNVQCWNCAEIFSFQPDGEINLHGYDSIEKLIEVGCIEETFKMASETQ